MECKWLSAIAGSGVIESTGPRRLERGGNPGLWQRFLEAYMRSVQRYLKVGHYDEMVVGNAEHINLLLARTLVASAHKPLEFEAFVSLHNSILNSHGLAKRGAMRGR